MKILFCSTATQLTTGYAKISAQILNYLAQYHEVVHIAFQANSIDKIPRKIDPRIKVIPDDLFAVDTILEHIDEVKPDYVMVYNDVIVCSNYCKKFKSLEHKNFKIFMYLDLTYEHQNWVLDIAETCDLLICFHKTWMKHVIDMGVDPEKVTYLDHPPIQISKQIHTNIFKFKEDDFVILNLNRNSYRKMLDITLDGFIRFFKQNGCSPKIKLFLGCKFQYNGSYNINMLAQKFSKIHGLTPGEQDTLLNTSIIKFPQDSVSDDIINQVYMSCDIGINTCGGEGYGLCNIEHQMYEKPQIVTGIKNFYEFFSPLSTYFMPPITKITIPQDLDVVGGFLEIPDSKDLTTGLQFYYDNPYLRENHGIEGKKFLTNRYNNFSNLKNLFE
tara:strand:- start:1393 stop:2550 length:1158 start_codon:yes stop_codon:yes gene_type:complete